MTANGDMEHIILCEPQCWGFEHAHANAALLDTALLAFPQARVVFMGEPGHLEWVRQTLFRHDPSVKGRVDWCPIKIPPRSLGLRRLTLEVGWCSALFSAAAKLRARWACVCSLTGPGLLMLKMWLHGRPTPVSVVAVPHSILSTVLLPDPRNPLRRLLCFRRVLRMPHPKGLVLIALGESIYQGMSQAMPDMAQHFRPLPLPSFGEDGLGYCEGENPHSDSTLRFGYLGVGNINKGFEAFARLAREVSSYTKKASFELVGFLPVSTPALDCSGISRVPREPLTPDEYRTRLAGLTYVVSTANPEHYRLVASASLLDALAFCKPGIYLRNPYVEQCFAEMGDIGYWCDDYEEVRDSILSLISDFPAARYQEQCLSIRGARELFAPTRLAPQLRAIVNGVETEQG